MIQIHKNAQNEIKNFQLPQNSAILSDNRSQKVILLSNSVLTFSEIIS